MEMEKENALENNQKLDKFAKNLENDFLNFGENESEMFKNVQNISNHGNYVCPDYVLDYLQDKPIWLQKKIICKGLSAAEIKEVEFIFKPSPDELRISREIIKKRIEELVNTYPELEKYLKDESVFLIHWGLSFVERRNLTQEYFASKEAA